MTSQSAQRTPLWNKILSRDHNIVRKDKKDPQQVQSEGILREKAHDWYNLEWLKLKSQGR
jgi:hypothetical protein